jgi:hypothetical protein
MGSMCLKSVSLRENQCKVATKKWLGWQVARHPRNSWWPSLALIWPRYIIGCGKRLTARQLSSTQLNIRQYSSPYPPSPCFLDTTLSSSSQSLKIPPTMLSTGFTNAPISRSLAYGIVAASILASIADTKHYFYIQVDPHLWRYHQLWRIFTYQLCYTNSTEVLFAAMTIYNMRVIERLWGSRKYAVCLLYFYPSIRS